MTNQGQAYTAWQTCISFSVKKRLVCDASSRDDSCCAQAGLTRCQCPWTLGPVTWDLQRVKQAAIWLSQRVNKPLLKLTDADYNAHSLQASEGDHKGGVRGAKSRPKAQIKHAATRFCMHMRVCRL